MRTTLLALLVICASSFITDFTLEISALEDAGSIDVSGQKGNAGANPKISPILTKTLDRMAATTASRNGAEGLSADDISTSLVKVDKDGNVQVYVHMSESSSGNIEQLKGIGLVPEITNGDLNIVQGWLPGGSLDEAAGLGFVSRITPPSYGHTRVGDVTTEGDEIMRSDDARAAFGVDGAGIKVGVISDGVDSLAASQMSGDLPDDVEIGDPGDGDEGTAMLEIVHDIAPGADLAFYSGGDPITSLGFIEAIEFLTDNGADVIVDDIGFLSEPFFQDGSVAQAAAGAVENGIVYVSAAGNDRDAHYQALFLPTEPDDPDTELHDFGLAADEGSDVGMTIALPPNSSSVVVLQWSNPFGEASDDYDLFLVDPDTADIIDSSTDTQNGNDDPIEVAGVSNDGPGTGFFDIVINKFSGEDQTLEIFFNQSGTPLEFNVPENSVYGHPAAPGVMAVGAAIDGEVDFFSSEGPSSIFFPPTVTVSSALSARAAPLLEDRDTPTLVAPNRVSTTVPGFTNFAGTSASAPHVAGVAALVLEALDSGAVMSSSAEADSIVSARQAEEVTDILTGTADDLPPGGYDNISGFGSVDACAAVAEALGEDENECVNAPPPPGNGDPDDSGGCSVYGSSSSYTAGTVFTNILILLIPAFVTVFGLLRRRVQ